MKSTDTAIDPRAMQPSPLLCLPGELRNRIYEMAVENMRKSPVSLVEPQRASQWRRTTPANTTNWSTFKRVHLGLTQVNRRIRREFLPLHEAKFEAGIEIAELHAYLTHVLSKLKNNLCTKVCAKVFVKFPGDFQVPIRDLIMLCSTIPDEIIRLRTTAFGMDQGRMERLLFAQHNPRWLKYIARCVSRVEVQTATTWDSGIGGGVTGLSVYLKPEWVEKWMRYSGRLTYGKDVSDWRYDCGLEDLGSLASPHKDQELVDQGLDNDWTDEDGEWTDDESMDES